MTARLGAVVDHIADLHAAAIFNTGFDDFGEQTYRHGLEVLLEAYAADLHLTPSGWATIHRENLDILCARLRTQRSWSERPDVLATAIRRPLIIVGLPRTGTTALHRLLSEDSQFQGLQFWLTQTPMTRPPRATWETITEYQACCASRNAFYARTPQFRAVHSVQAADVAECTSVLRHSFLHSSWPACLGLPTYSSWLRSQDMRESYRHYADVLRLIGAAEPQKRWLLKCPFHMSDMDALLDVFPDACIIQTHRDPLRAIPSFCSFLHIGLGGLARETAIATLIGPRQCAHWRLALDCMLTARRKLPLGQLYDVDHRNFVADPLGIVRSIYECFDLNLSLEAEQRMRKWIEASSTLKHGEHKYTTRGWGVTESEICAAFADYRAQHLFK